MSSSNSNAAARRRRAGPSIPPPMSAMTARVTPQPRMPQQPPQVNQQRAQNSQNSQNSTSPTSSAATTPRPVMTPAQMLIAHENRITELEKAIPEIMQNFTMLEEEEEQAQAQAQVQEQPVVNNEAQEAFNVETTKHISTIEKKNSELSNRVVELENELKAIQKSFNLLRDFATETNVLLMKVFNSENMVMSSNVDDEVVEDPITTSQTTNSVTFGTVQSVTETTTDNETTDDVTFPKTA